MNDNRERFIAENSEYNFNEDLVTFTLIDESTVARRQREGDIRLPAKKVDVPKDMRWNTKQMNSKLLAGILNGDSVPKIAHSLVDVIGNNKASATRNARTMVTQAECGGRQDSYESLAAQGVVQKKVWIATPDDRTRESHIDLDGEEVDIDEDFSNGLEYPADPSGEPEEVWNCRCSMRTHIVGFRRADGTIAKVDYERDDTMHDKQMAAERKERGIEAVVRKIEPEVVKPAIMFKPAETIEDAQRFVEENLGLSTADYDKINVEYANMLNETLVDYYNTFGNLHELGVLDEIRVVPKLSSVAGYQPQMKSVLLKKSNVSTKNAIKKAIKEAEEQYNFGWWSTGNEKTVVCHELGHAVHQAFVTDSIYDRKDYAIKALFEETKIKCGIDKWNGINEDMDKIKKCGDVLSYYGLRNHHEFVAEAICEYMASENPRETAIKVHDILIGE